VLLGGEAKEHVWSFDRETRKFVSWKSNMFREDNIKIDV